MNVFMDKLVVRGRKRLTGEVTISGAKNAAVAVIPAAVMATGVSDWRIFPVLRTLEISVIPFRKWAVNADF